MNRVLNTRTALTGRFFHKKAWFGGLVLMVEEKMAVQTEESGSPNGLQIVTYTETYYRKAKESDLVSLCLK
jgi:hypothetical protein